MILVDANLLIYAVNAESSHHRAARRWLERTLSAGEGVGFAWIVILAFLRITTNPHVFERPLDTVGASVFVDEWLGQPGSTVIMPGEHHWPILRNLLVQSGTAGNLTSDAHLAALAIEHGAAVYSADHDFKRFPGIEHINPLSIRP